MKNEIKNLFINLDATQAASQYDMNAKILLANRYVLAHILSGCAEEFEGMDPKDIVPYIEGDPEVSSRMVNPGMTNAPGISKEDSAPNEGRVFYDVFVRVLTPQGERKGLIIHLDTEIANSFHPGYPLASRIVFFLARMISSQGDRDFSLADQEYGNIARAYSVWTIFNAPKYAQDTITKISLKKEMMYGEEFPFTGFDLMEGIMICIPEDGKSGNTLISLLYTIFTNSLTGREKKKILEEEFGIHLSKKEAEIMEVTNGLASYVMEKAAKEGYGKGYGKGYDQGYGQGYGQGYDQGYDRGSNEINRQNILRMHEKGMNNESIAMFLDLPLEKVTDVIQKK